VAAVARALVGRCRLNVEPMKPTLKAPGTKRLKLKCNLHSSSGFNFNLRPYALDTVRRPGWGRPNNACHVIDTQFESWLIELNGIL